LTNIDVIGHVKIFLHCRCISIIFNWEWWDL